MEKIQPNTLVSKHNTPSTTLLKQALLLNFSKPLMDLSSIAYKNLEGFSFLRKDIQRAILTSSSVGELIRIFRQRERTASVTFEELLQQRIRRQDALYFSIVLRRECWASLESLSTSLRTKTENALLNVSILETLCNLYQIGIINERHNSLHFEIMHLYSESIFQ